MAKRELDAYTLRWAARKAEKEAQLTYDQRDEMPAEMHQRWGELDYAARLLSGIGRQFADKARALTKPPSKRSKR